MNKQTTTESTTPGAVALPNINIGILHYEPNSNKTTHTVEIDSSIDTTLFKEACENIAYNHKLDRWTKFLFTPKKDSSIRFHNRGNSIIYSSNKLEIKGFDPNRILLVYFAMKNCVDNPKNDCGEYITFQSENLYDVLYKIKNEDVKKLLQDYCNII